MDVRAVVSVSLAVGCSAVALVGLWAAVDGYEEQLEAAQRGDDEVYVVVAARDLYQGIGVTEDDLYAVQFPTSELPEGVFLTPEHVVGRVPRERILANELVRAERLARPEVGEGLHAVIPRGQRAVSIDLDGGRALQGVLEPGSFVDVLVTVTPDEAGAEAQTSTLLQAMYVLAVNSRQPGEPADVAAARGADLHPSVTLLVGSDQAEQLAHAQQVGEVRVVLRSGVDRELVPDLTGVRCGLRPCPLQRVAPSAPQERGGPTCLQVTRVEGDARWEEWVHADGTPCQPASGSAP